jgi:hypothetical protein
MQSNTRLPNTQAIQSLHGGQPAADPEDLLPLERNHSCPLRAASMKNLRHSTGNILPGPLLKVEGLLDELEGIKGEDTQQQWQQRRGSRPPTALER